MIADVGLSDRDRQIVGGGNRGVQTGPCIRDHSIRTDISSGNLDRRETFEFLRVKLLEPEMVGHSRFQRFHGRRPHCCLFADMGLRHELLQAEAIASGYGARTVGSFGRASCLSFYPAKNLGAYGDGGMVLTNDEPLADRLRMLRNHGSRRKYEHEFLGVSSRLDTLQAAILRVKLPHLRAWNERRRERAAQYAQRLRGVPDLILPPMPSSNLEPVFQQFTVRAKRRDDLAAFLKKAGIPTAIHYPKPLHLQPALADLGYGSGDFPEAERASAAVLSLPMSPFLKDADLERIASAIRHFYDT